MELTTVWFLLIAVLWSGYFVLEGFDFGVGMLLPIIGRDERDRSAMVRTIGPVWDGNEVWVLTAGGATFAAFPEWYATLFSGFYLPLFLILVALIVRGISIEYRHKRADETWQRRCSLGITVGSFAVALLWGVAFANIVRGVPIDADHTMAPNLLTLLNPVGLLGGLLFVAVFLTHGAVFLALRTTGHLRERARRAGMLAGLVTAVLAIAFVAWHVLTHPESVASTVLLVGALVVFLGAWVANALGREAWAFAGTALSIVLVVAGLFVGLFPNVLPSTLDPAWSLTVHNGSSTPKTLGIMTVAALVFTPVVIGYQAWTYWVFRRRVASPPVQEERDGHDAPLPVG